MKSLRYKKKKALMASGLSGINSMKMNRKFKIRGYQRPETSKNKHRASKYQKPSTSRNKNQQNPKITFIFKFLLINISKKAVTVL